MKILQVVIYAILAVLLIITDIVCIMNLSRLIKYLGGDMAFTLLLISILLVSVILIIGICGQIKEVIYND